MFSMVLQQQRQLVYKQFTLTVLLLMQFLKNGAAIKCYVCDSSDNPGCADLESNSSIVAEDCTLDKMKSIDTWLFELNKFAYFDTGANKHPLMNCQKVVAKDPHTTKIVTARFCQLNTGESDACAILQAKLHSLQQQYHNTNSNNKNNNKHQKQQNLRDNIDNNNYKNYYNGQHSQQSRSMAEEDESQSFHCSICTVDSCNGSISILTINSSFLLLQTLFLFCITKSISKLLYWQNHIFNFNW